MTDLAGPLAIMIIGMILLVWWALGDHDNDPPG